MDSNDRSKSKKLRRREMSQAVALEFRRILDPRPPEPRLIRREPRRRVPHYELAEAAIKEFIDVIDGVLSQNRSITLRGFGTFIPRRYKPMRVRLPGADPNDEQAVFDVPVRLGVTFRPSKKLKQAIRERDEEHGLP